MLVPHDPKSLPVHQNGVTPCLAKCPFSEMGYEKVKARFKGNPKAPQFRIPVFAKETNS